MTYKYKHTDGHDYTIDTYSIATDGENVVWRYVIRRTSDILHQGEIVGQGDETITLHNVLQDWLMHVMSIALNMAAYKSRPI